MTIYEGMTTCEALLVIINLIHLYGLIISIEIVIVAITMGAVFRNLLRKYHE